MLVKLYLMQINVIHLISFINFSYFSASLLTLIWYLTRSSFSDHFIAHSLLSVPLEIIKKTA